MRKRSAGAGLFLPAPYRRGRIFFAPVIDRADEIRYNSRIAAIMLDHRFSCPAKPGNRKDGELYHNAERYGITAVLRLLYLIAIFLARQSRAAEKDGEL